MQISRLFSKHSTTLFFLIAGLGFTISTLVYLRGDDIVSNINQLVRNKIPAYDNLRLLNNQLSEQERYLYEFYATQDESVFDKGFKTANLLARNLVENLEDNTFTHEARELVNLQLMMITNAADNLHAALADDAQQWDTAREELLVISEARRNALPALLRLQQNVQREIYQKSLQANTNVQSVRYLVIAYSFAIAILIFIFARAINAYFNASNQRERLAMFPHRTPNPIITLDRHNQIVFSNPAYQRLTDKLGMSDATIWRQISEQLSKQQALAQSSAQGFRRFEVSLAGYALECELHWLSVQQEWDLHLTDITARKQAEKRLTYQATHHPDSGLFNEYQLQARLQTLFEEQQNSSLVLIQLRQHAQLLSSMGSQATKQLCSELGIGFSQLTSKIASPNSDVFHLGDHTFAIIFATTLTPDGLTSVLRQLFSYVEQYPRIQSHQLEIDAGVVNQTTLTAPDDMMRYAHMALERAAASDVAGWTVYDAQLGSQVERARQLIADMRDALQHDAFELYFQPQARLDNQQMVGAEVLLRWNKDGEFVSPGEFIPLAESCGLILPLGDWVLNKACQQAMQLFADAGREFVVAVNISPIQFSQRDFLDKVRHALQSSGMPAHLLELEITEGATMHNELDTISLLHELHDLGVMLSIDDFGTGYSSLSYLSRFPLHKLKIDQSFVRHLLSDPNYLSIVHSVIELGKSLNLTLIAEGVEEPKQAELLRELGCAEMQGYLYSRPLPYDQLLSFIQRH